MSETTMTKEPYGQVAIIERALSDDATAIMMLKRNAWLDAYVSPEHGVTVEDIHKKFDDNTLATGIENWQKGIANETETGDRITLVARVNGNVVGYTSPCTENGQRRIGAMYVSPDSQGQGIGGKLLTKALEWHGSDENVYLHVVSYNDNAIAFYERYGFHKTGVIIPEEFDEQQGIKLLPEIEMVLPAKKGMGTGEVKTDNIEQELEMDADYTAELIRLFEQNGLVYVDGGWGVDALLGKQTRRHNDLDIALPHKYVPKLRELLEARGYKNVPRDDTRDCNFVLGDDTGHQVDIHSYTFDENGNNIFGIAYEPRHLTGVGSIAGQNVKCIPPDVMIEFHSGYELDDDDYHDVKALCDRYDIPLPDEYSRFVEAGKTQ